MQESTAERISRDRKDLPWLGDPFEIVDTAGDEPDTRARHEISDRTGHQHLSRIGQSGDSGADVDGEPGHVVTDDLQLAGVEAAAHLDPE